jgi:hypothetical protein
MVLTKFVFPGKSHVGHIASSARFPADTLTQIIHNDEMKAGLRFSLRRPRYVVRKYPVKDFNELEDAHLKTSFFVQFACNALLKRFPELQCPSWYRPFAAERFAAAANQQSAAVVDDHAADTDDGALGIFAAGGHFRNSAPERFTIEGAAPRIRVDLGQRGI